MKVSILTILVGIWFFYRGNKLKKTKDIEKYVWRYSKKIKDKDGYINLYSKIYFLNGLFFILFEVFCILNEYYFDLPFKSLMVSFGIVFVLVLIWSVLIEKKAKQFTY